MGYPRCDCAPYVNAYPPHGEMGVLATTVLGGTARYVALVQASAFVALAVGVIGVARGLGLSRREALLGALLVATLPVIALQASTAQNDLVVAAFLVAAVALLLDTGRGAPWLAGGATALAVGTKVTAVFGIPILLVVAFLAASTRRGQRLTGVLVGAAAGAYWYVVNWVEAGSWDAGFPYERVEPGIAAAVARGLRSAIQLVELPGAPGRDRWLYLVAAAVLLVGLAFAYRRRSATAALGSAAGAALLAALPVLTPDVRRYVDEAYLELWRAVGRDDLAVTVGRDITRSASNVTWYGPLGALLVVAGIVLAVIAARRGIVPWLGAVLTLTPVYWIAAMSARPLLPGRRRPVSHGTDRARRRDLGPRRTTPTRRMGARRDRGHRRSRWPCSTTRSVRPGFRCSSGPRRRATGRPLAGARSGARCTSPT